MKVKLTGLERTIVDVSDRSDLGGGWEEVWRSLDNVTSIDTALMVEYALLLKNATVFAKAWFS